MADKVRNTDERSEGNERARGVRSLPEAGG
jgi:hypothetical protein